jgi:hypothetical protein
MASTDHFEAMAGWKDCPGALRQSTDFELCHHCKQLFEKAMLVKCEYRSSTHGVPMQNSAASDPFHILHLLQNQRAE